MKDTRPDSAATNAPITIATENGPRSASPVCASTAPRSETPSNPPARDKALLKPYTMPVCSGSTETRTVLVSGATKIAIPSAISATAGKTFVQ